MKYFYSHIIQISDLHRALEDAGYKDHQRKELVLIAEESIHHIVIDTILSELPEEDKKIFLTHLHEEDHEKIWLHLRNKIVDVEDKIHQAVSTFLAKLHKDIKRD
jgi:hypothetical protein